ncbi:Pimeloyl-ACP methyl ester carboxylesterase [Pedobacter sp. ok626]|uniref:alpha/beta fold hydrolase n=1 Tax=Pedobacter sp. ok626 TaxID=1761882 RepID=UPI00088E4DE6|nr:alpha/beta hydrolase [Pedobacter sp. ok626]SDJ55643.1 Pimeloyl-ACP methyl ester carboxylesterase [Pedobacter sp. ok626]
MEKDCTLDIIMAKRIYLISGLGADRRAFKKLVFPTDIDLVYLDWITPELGESLESYASRLALKIDTSIPFYLIGLSFGGMLATEIAKKLSPVHTFLISSTPVFSGLPWYYKRAGNLRLQKMIPVALFKRINNIGMNFLGAKTHDERVLLKQLIIDSDPNFIKWALTCILKWRNKERPSNLTHIHGTADIILPVKYHQADITIKGGGHFMVYSDAKEVSDCILKEINKI